MMRSLYSGVTGLRNHQTKMDVIGNNIANVNTVGYKSSRVVFQDIYSQTLAPASAPDADSGGTNPMQVGLGVSLSTIDVLHTKSAAQYTGSELDLSIEGDGFFTVKNGTEEYVTRAGNFYTDSDNNLVTSNGYMVQGYRVNVDGAVDQNPATTTALGVAGVTVTRSGDVVEDTYTISQDTSTPPHFIVTNSSGDFQDLGAILDGDGTVQTVNVSDFGITIGLPGDYTVGDLNGRDIVTYGTGSLYDTDNDSSNGTQSIIEDIVIPTDYYNISINESGQVVGIDEDTNKTKVLAQLALSNFDNQNALEKVGSNMYVKTVNSGDPVYNAPGQGAAGKINPGTLEMSNVDLANEFTDMIVTQRGFQANSRIITTTDSMLEELVNIKR